MKPDMISSLAGPGDWAGGLRPARAAAQDAVRRNREVAAVAVHDVTVRLDHDLGESGTFQLLIA